MIPYRFPREKKLGKARAGGRHVGLGSRGRSEGFGLGGDRRLACVAGCSGGSVVGWGKCGMLCDMCSDCGS